MKLMALTLVDRQSLAKCPSLPHLKHGPFRQGGGLSVCTAFPCTLWSFHRWPPHRFGGALVHVDVSMGTGVLFSQGGALVKLYCHWVYWCVFLGSGFPLWKNGQF